MSLASEPDPHAQRPLTSSEDNAASVVHQARDAEFQLPPGEFRQLLQRRAERARAGRYGVALATLTPVLLGLVWLRVQPLQPGALQSGALQSGDGVAKISPESFSPAQVVAPSLSGEAASPESSQRFAEADTSSRAPSRTATGHGSDSGPSATSMAPPVVGRTRPLAPAPAASAPAARDLQPVARASEPRELARPSATPGEAPAPIATTTEPSLLTAAPREPSRDATRGAPLTTRAAGTASAAPETGAASGRESARATPTNCQALVQTGQYLQASVCHGERAARSSGTTAELALLSRARLELKALHRADLALQTLAEYKRRFPQGALQHEAEIAESQAREAR